MCCTYSEVVSPAPFCNDAMADEISARAASLLSDSGLSLIVGWVRVYVLLVVVCGEADVKRR